MSTPKKPAVKKATKPKAVSPNKKPANNSVSKINEPESLLSYPFAKTIVCSERKILISLVALPTLEKEVLTTHAEVQISTVLHRASHKETVVFDDIYRACQYIADFAQPQANRFAQKATLVNAKVIADENVNSMARSVLMHRN